MSRLLVSPEWKRCYDAYVRLARARKLIDNIYDMRNSICFGLPKDVVKAKREKIAALECELLDRYTNVPSCPKL